MKRSLWGAITLLLVLGSWILDSHPVLADDSPFTIKVENQSISIEVKDASALDVLKDLGDKADIEVRIFEGVEDRTLSLNVKNHPLDEMTRLFQRMNLNYVYGHEGDASHMIIYVLPEGKKEGDPELGVPLGPPPDIETVWKRTFDGQAFGIGSPDGRVVVIDHMPERKRKHGAKDRFELIIMDDEGNPIWSRKFDQIYYLSVTPSWNRIVFSEYILEGDVPNEKGFPTPNMNVTIYNDRGEVLGKMERPYGMVYAGNDVIYYQKLFEGGGSGGSIIYNFSGEKVGNFGVGDYYSYSMPDGDGMIDYGPHHLSVFGDGGKFNLKYLEGEFFRVTVRDDYIASGKNVYGVGSRIDLYHLPSGREILSFDDTKPIPLFDISPNGQQAAIFIDVSNQLYLYDLDTVRLVGKFDLSSDWEKLTRFTQIATDTVESPDKSLLRFNGEKVFILGKQRIEGVPYSAPSPVVLGAWDTKGNLLWKTQLTREGYNAKFVGDGVDEVIVWTKAGVEKIQIGGK